MKKALIFVFVALAFLIYGCGQSKEEELFVAIGKVNIVTGGTASQPLSLKLIANQEIGEISVVTTDASADFSYTVAKMKTLGLGNKETVAHTYLLDFEFCEPTTMTKLTLQLDDEIIDFDIGSFQYVDLDQTLTTMAKGTSPHLTVSQFTNLEQGFSFVQPTQIALYLNNLTAENVFIKDIQVFAPNEISVSVVKVIQPRSFLRGNETNKFAHIYFKTTDEKTLHASAIIQISYTYCGEDYCHFFQTECGYTTEILKSEIIGNVITTSSFISGVARASAPK